jgi:hypothetical protein
VTSPFLVVSKGLDGVLIEHTIPEYLKLEKGIEI